MLFFLFTELECRILSSIRHSQLGSVVCAVISKLFSVVERGILKQWKCLFEIVWFRLVWAEIMLIADQPYRPCPVILSCHAFVYLTLTQFHLGKQKHAFLIIVLDLWWEVLSFRGVFTGPEYIKGYEPYVDFCEVFADCLRYEVKWL